MKYIVVSYLFVFILNLVCCTNNKKEVFSNLQGCWQFPTQILFTLKVTNWLFVTMEFNFTTKAYS